MLAGRHGQGCVVVGVERERPVVLITRFVLGSIDSVEPKRITKKPELRGFRVYTGAVAAVDITDEAARAKLALAGPGLWHANRRSR